MRSLPLMKSLLLKYLLQDPHILLLQMKLTIMNFMMTTSRMSLAVRPLGNRLVVPSHFSAAGVMPQGYPAPGFSAIRRSRWGRPSVM